MHSRNKKDVTPCKKVYKKFNPNIVALLRLVSHRYAVAEPFLQESSDTESESAESTNTGGLGGTALRCAEGRHTHGGLVFKLA